MQKVLKIQLRSIHRENLSEYILCHCSFCEKRVEVQINYYENCIRLGHGQFYCPFCLRHNQTAKSRKHVLLLDFKGIIGYAYYWLYPDREIWLSEIVDQIAKHVQIGLNNPVFNYDPESFLWFVDFSRVGDTKHKMPLTQVKNTISDIIDAFTILGNVNVLKKKYDEAIDLWYQKRKRPENRRVLSPTLNGVVFQKITDWESTKQIEPSCFSEIQQLIPSSVQAVCEDLSAPALDKIAIEIKHRKIKNTEGWQGILTIPGLSPSKLVQKDGNCLYTTRQALSAAVRSLSHKLGVPICKNLPPTSAEPPTT